MRATNSKSGFTLVELLVVIGIIAVLISILLPSLNRARGAAKSITCQAKLHDIGLLMAEYAAGNRGYIPWGYVTTPSNGGSNHYYNQNAKEWSWCDTLSLLTNHKSMDQGGTYAWAGQWVGNMAFDYSKVFHDADTLAGGYAIRASDYTAHPRLLPSNTQIDPIAAKKSPPVQGYMTQRTFASVKQASSVMMVWDAGVRILADGLSNGTANIIDGGIDGSAFTYGYSLSTTPAETWVDPKAQNNLISLGNTAPASNSLTNNVTSYTLRAQNHDSTNQYYNDAASMRFRHIQNTSANILFVDGHVEGRLLGQVTQRDISVNPVTYTTVAP